MWSKNNSSGKKMVGHLVWELALKYAKSMNESEFATSLRNRKLIKSRYLGYIAAMYPIVIGFNRALIRSVAKVDHVHEAAFVKGLTEQLHEEQEHNSLWRKKLDAFGIDHGALYMDLLDYLAQFTPQQLDRMTKDVIKEVTKDVTEVSPGCFPDPIFPEPVLALYHHLWMTASHENIDYWEYYAGQYGIEVIIFEVVSSTITRG